MLQQATPPAGYGDSRIGFDVGTVDSAWWVFIRGVPRLPAQTNVGSYAVNGWLVPPRMIDDKTYWPNWYEGVFPGPGCFGTDGDVNMPAATPVVTDSIWWVVWPAESDHGGFFTVSDMLWVAIARHGSRPNPVPPRWVNWPADQPLPGAVNVSFFDGHGELVKLDRLWQLDWHKDYQPPAKRPGLP